MASFRRRLTANGPSAAYETLLLSQRNANRSASSDHGSAIARTVDIQTATSQLHSHSNHNVWSMHERRERRRSEFDSDDQARRVRQAVSDNRGVQDSQIGVAETSRSGGGEIPRRMNRDNNRAELTPLRETEIPGGGRTPRQMNRDNNRVELTPLRETEIPGAFDRLQFENLKRQVKEYREIASNLQKIQTRVLERVAELPRHCKWECVSRVLTDVVSSLLIGNDVSCCMYPSDTDLIPRILASFGIKMEQQEEVEKFLTQWGTGGQESLQLHVYDNIRDRRGSLLRVLRAEFYIQLGVPKPRDGEEEKLIEWKSQLACLKRTREWRVSMVADSMDPWGSEAVHHSIARVLQGIRYDRALPLTLSINQAGFFLYNLELAIEGRVMEASRMNIHHRGMSDMENRIKLALKDMKRIVVLMK